MIERPLSKARLDQATLRHGDRIIRRGRPPKANKKQMTTLREIRTCWNRPATSVRLANPDQRSVAGCPTQAKEDPCATKGACQDVHRDGWPGAQGGQIQARAMNHRAAVWPRCCAKEGGLDPTNATRPAPREMAS